MLLLTAVGAYVGPTISEDYYFGFAGLAILLITAFAWYAGRNRDAFKGIWEFIWVDFGIFLGLFGVESSNYPAGLTRGYKTPMDRMLPMITVVGGYAGLMDCIRCIWIILYSVLYYCYWCCNRYAYVWSL